MLMSCSLKNYFSFTPYTPQITPSFWSGLVCRVTRSILKVQSCCCFFSVKSQVWSKTRTKQTSTESEFFISQKNISASIAYHLMSMQTHLWIVRETVRVGVITFLRHYKFRDMIVIENRILIIRPKNITFCDFYCLI